MTPTNACPAGTASLLGRVSLNSACKCTGRCPCCTLTTSPRPNEQRRPDTGVIDHVAFGSRGFEAVKQHLTGKGVPHRLNQVPNSTRWQIFLHDPNNVEIELNFETKNETGA
jgi:hypothetical protein